MQINIDYYRFKRKVTTVSHTSLFKDMAVKSDSKATTTSFHEMLRTVYENNKNDVSEDQKKTISYDDHIEDPFHPNNIFNRTQNFPTVGNPHAARCAAERILLSDSGQLLDLSDQEGHTKAAKLLFLSQANTFQHKMLMQLGNKLMKSKELEKPTERDTEEAVFSKNQKEQLVFERYDETTVIDKSVILPTNWTVVQISATDFLVSRFRSLKAKQPLSSNPSLTLVRMSGGRVRVGRCEGPPDQGISFMKECQQIQEQFVTIVKEYSNSVKNDGKNLIKAKEKESYWSERFNLEGRLKSLVESIENSWLGYEKAALLGTLVREEDRDKVRTVVKDCITADMKESQRTFIEQLLSATPFLTEQQIRRGLLQKVSSLDEDEVEKLIKVARSQLSCLSESRRHPVILILDNETQGLPWESLPSLRSCRQAVSRVPSVPFLYCLWSAHNSSQDSVLTEGVAQDNVFYVLNPDKSLGKTEEKMKEVLKRETCSNWEGVVGQVPQKVQLTKALQEKVRRDKTGLELMVLL